MEEKKAAGRFNQELDDILAGEIPSGRVEDPEVSDMLRLGEAMAKADFSHHSSLKAPLRQKLAAQSMHVYDRERRKRMVSGSVNQIFSTAVWIGLIGALVFTLAWAIQNMIAPGTPPNPPAVGAQPGLQPTRVDGIQASPAPLPLEAGPEEASGFRLEAGAIVEVEDGFIIPLALIPLDPELGVWVYLPDSPERSSRIYGDSQAPFVFTDSQRRQVYYQLHDHPSWGGEGWSYKTKGKDIAWPLTIGLTSAFVTYQGEQAEYRLDTGEEPASGQKWEVNERLELGGGYVDLLSVEFLDGIILINFDRQSSVRLFEVEIQGGLEGRVSSSNAGPWVFEFEAGPEVSPGELEILVKNPELLVTGPWEVQVDLDGISTFLDAGESASELMQRISAVNLELGWIYREEEHIGHSGMQSPQGGDYPEHYYRVGWYYVNEDGVIEKSVDLDKGIDGESLQITVYANGYSSNSFFGEVSEREPYPAGYLLKDSDLIDWLVRNVSDTSSSISVFVEDSDTDPAYIFIVEEYIPEPVLHPDLGEPFTGSIAEYYFDAATGFMKRSVSWTILESDGSRQLRYEINYKRVIDAQPPLEILDLIEQYGAADPVLPIAEQP